MADYSGLAKFFSGPVQGPSNVDVAKYILLHADNTKTLGPGAQSPNSPSLMGRIFDLLSRPNYAIANLAKNLPQDISQGDPGKALEDLWKGFSGQDKTTFSDVLKSQGVTDPATSAAGGLALDILADPTSYVTGAGIAKLGKALGIGGKASEEAAQTLGQKILQKGEPVHPESFGLEPNPSQNVPLALNPKAAPQNVPAVDLPGAPVGKFNMADNQLMLDLPDIPKTTIASKDIVTPPVGKTKELPGQVSLNLGKLSDMTKPASQIVEDIGKGDAKSLARIIPLPTSTPSKQAVRIADDVLAKFNPGKATAEINKKFPDTLNAKQQLKLYYSAREAASKTVYRKGRNPAKVAQQIDQLASDIYHTAENKLTSTGWTPRIGTGDNVSLSDVIKDFNRRNVPITDEVLKDFGTEIKPGTELYSTIQNLRSRNAIIDSEDVKNVVNKITESRQQTQDSNLLSNAQLFDFDKFLKNFGKASAKASGVSPAGQKATTSMLNTVFDSTMTPAQIAIAHNKNMITQIMTNGVQNPALAHAVTLGLQKDLGKLPAWAVSNNKAVEFLMGRVATWWGQKDLRPLSLNAIGSAAATAAARGRALHDLLAPFDLAQRTEAIRLAQGFDTASSPEVDQLATQIKRMMDNLVGNVSGTSVITNAALDRNMLNNWMSRYGVGFKFTNSNRVQDITGKFQNYSKGIDWVNSWKTADLKGKDPEKFLFTLQQAIEQATREKALYEELGQRFGQRIPGGGFKNTISGHPYLKGYYFTDDIAKQIPRLVKDWSIPAWSPQSPMVKLYDRVMSMWKSGVTIYRPSHHIRNLAGDIYLGFLDGVNTARPYALAARVQRTMKSAYPDLLDVDELVKMGLMPKTMSTPKPGEILFRNKSGVPFTAEQIGAVAHQKGLLENSRSIEDIIDLGEQGSKGLLNVKPFGGKVQKYARSMSEMIGHNTRLAHFIDKVAKSHGNNLGDIFEQAARRARKWHPTGLDLTDFEKKYLRRIIPFYSWLRKSTPLLLEGLVMQPGKTLLPSKLYGAAQDAAGIDTPGRDNPFPVDQMFPQWLRAQGLGPVGLPDGILGPFSNQQPAGYVMAGVGLNPLSELMSQIEQPQQTILSGITPVVGVPLDLLQGKNSFTGAPITGPQAKPGALQQYIGEQIPIASLLQGLTGFTPFGTETSKVNKSGNDARIEALTNFLSGAGIKGTGPYVKQANMERKDANTAKNQALKYDFLNNLKG